MTDPRTLWNLRYARHNEHNIKRFGDPWLTRWQRLIETARQDKILDLGCGSGCDSCYLTESGYNVIAADFSNEALRICRQIAPKATHLQIDIRNPLAFPDGYFQIIVADLSLHYFHWRMTQCIVAEIYRCLKFGGFLFARVNSTRDVKYGAVGYPEVEQNLFLVNGELKRFFDRESVEKLFEAGWRVHGIQEMTVERYKEPKILWEVVLEKNR